VPLPHWLLRVLPLQLHSVSALAPRRSRTAPPHGPARFASGPRSVSAAPRGPSRPGARERGRAPRAQYKFIVDGDWKYAPDQPAMYDEDGNVNNVLEVQEYVPENLASLSSFDPPPSPPERRRPPSTTCAPASQMSALLVSAHGHL
jgi:hypothetical protein